MMEGADGQQGSLPLAGLEYGGASQPAWIPPSCAAGKGRGGCVEGQGVMQGGHDPTLAPGFHLIMPGGDLLVNQALLLIL